MCRCVLTRPECTRPRLHFGVDLRFDHQDPACRRMLPSLFHDGPLRDAAIAETLIQPLRAGVEIVN